MTAKKIIFGIVVGVAFVLGCFQIVDFPHWLDILFSSLFLTVWLFTAGIHARSMYRANNLDAFLLWSYMPLIVAVIILDVIFNATWGTIIFREWPREWLFTDRVQRHMRDPDNRTAQTWARRLNDIDPGHI